jgi:DNA-binding response OmpR family regulator
METPKRVLVVEDEVSMRLLLQHVFTKEGYAVTTATNGLEAKQLLSVSPFDLICSDVMMSGVDGIELCTWVKSQEEMKRTPFVILSSRAQLAEIADGYKAGADFYVTKPFQLANLLSTISKALAGEKKA